MIGEEESKVEALETVSLVEDGTTKTINPSARFSSGRLPFVLQHNHWKTYTQQMEGGHVHLLSESKILDK